MQATKSYLKDLVYQVNGAAIEVHKALGPGLLESVYHKCMKKELIIRGLQFQSEMLVPVHYKGLQIETELRCDFFVENMLVVELKAVEFILPIHEAPICLIWFKKKRNYIVDIRTYKFWTFSSMHL